MPHIIQQIINQIKKNTMKIKSLLLALVVALTVTMFTSCNKSQTPENAAVACMTAFYTADTATLHTYVTDDDTYAMFQMMFAFFPEEALKAMKESKPAITVKECKVSEDGNSAKVKLEIKDVVDFDSEDLQIVKEAVEEEIEMKKVEDKWVMGDLQ